MKKLFEATVHQGRIILEEKGRFMELLHSLQGKRVWVTVHPNRKPRSPKQNRYYWGVIIEKLRDHFGYTKDEMHDALKWEFLRIHEDGKPDRCGSTKNMNTVQFEKHNETIRQWAAIEHGIYLPLPNEVEL